GGRGKQFRIAARLWASLASYRVGRDGGIIALGGGSVGDVAGFVAATYLRGIRLAHVPTTLLGMADASIGGKTAIDIAAGKNLVGAFHSPDAVFADLAVLATLPPRQLSSGLAEVTKCAFLADRESVAQLARSLERRSQRARAFPRVSGASSSRTRRRAPASFAGSCRAGSGSSAR